MSINEVIWDYIKASKNVAISIDYEISDEELQQELNKKDSKKIIESIGDTINNNIKFDTYTYGYSGFHDGYETEEEILENEAYYLMDDLLVRIPIDTIETLGNKDKILDGLYKKLDELADKMWLEYEINDNNELQIIYYNFNCDMIFDFSEIFSTIKYTKEYIEDKFKQYGIIEALCIVDFLVKKLYVPHAFRYTYI